MARKSNKTAHVLNLLAGGSNTEVQEDHVKSEQHKKNTSNISLIDPAVTSDPLSSLIRESLDKEIIDHDSTQAHQEVSATAILDDNELNDDFVILDNIDMPEEAIEEPEAEAVVEKAEIPAAAAQLKDIDPVETAAKEELSPSSAVSVSDKAECDYEYVNILDFVVDERLMEFINRFGVCTCDRCVKDIKALAMTNLPAKYIVSPVASVPPLLSYYRNKYHIYVITELTKACLAVLENPRH